MYYLQWQGFIKQGSVEIIKIWQIFAFQQCNNFENMTLPILTNSKQEKMSLHPNKENFEEKFEELGFLIWFIFGYFSWNRLF